MNDLDYGLSELSVCDSFCFLVKEATFFLCCHEYPKKLGTRAHFSAFIYHGTDKEIEKTKTKKQTLLRQFCAGAEIRYSKLRITEKL